MNCNCKWLEVVVAAVVFIVAVWPNILGSLASRWVIAIAAIVLFIHSFSCRNCSMCGTEMKESRGAKPRKRR